METIRLGIPYWAIVRSSELCNELWVDERCVNEWIVSSYDTMTVEITKENKWILKLLYDFIEDDDN